MAAQDIYDPAYVRDVFDRCSDKYITFSYVCSMGFTERWRKQCVAMLDLPDGPLSGYDLMAGTGEVWPHLLERFPNIDDIRAVDISSGMHKRALERLHAMRAHRISFIEDDVLASDLLPQSADFVISTFGLKTFNRTQHKKLAALAARVLKPGGSFAFIEASDPIGWFLRPLYLFHLKFVLPVVERILLRGAQDFSMIGAYSTNFGNAQGFAQDLAANGLQVEYRKFFFGCATGVCGRKPD
ncbi:class I SAM-dependent methyltransferase [Erythrobacter sp. SDW2]|uniref:class I SAM-dependent methyltransferase n=1 Tax=Erythrobacter sp. SDW2 TaxID=2907154 RepID=UPI001F2F426D|nr:class I SAM-dependent methyltransferase [Erythrobacter sp. SDW2]UIP07985.1 class I SAM-dependent methyltransferase [Erythrobacter sp. SDW2]